MSYKIIWILIISLMLMSTVTGFGQTHYLGLKSGIILSNVNSNLFTNSNYRTGYIAGVTYDYKLKDKFNLGLDLLYSQKGFTENLIFIDGLGNETGEIVKYIFNYDYLSFPIKIGINVGNRISGLLNFGLIPSLLIDAKTSEPEIVGLLNKKTIDITSKVKKFDFGGLIEIGGNYKLNETILLFSSFTYNYSFTTITNLEYFDSKKINHYCITLSFGLKYVLKNKSNN